MYSSRLTTSASVSGSVGLDVVVIDALLPQRLTYGDRRLEHCRVELPRALLQRAERVLEALAGSLELELAQPFLDRGFAAALFVFGASLGPQTLLLDPELLLDQLLLGVL